MEAVEWWIRSINDTKCPSCGLGHAPLAAGLTVLCWGERAGETRERRWGRQLDLCGRKDVTQEALIEESIICPEDFVLRYKVIVRCVYVTI